MAKNGLFLCSIGFLIFLYSLNPNAMRYDLLSMVTGIFFVVVGGFLVFKARKKAEPKKQSE